MLMTIITAIITFIATSVDEMFVLTFLFAQDKNNQKNKQIYLGQQLGMLVLLAITLLAVLGIRQIPQAWIGFIGFVPVIQGIRLLIFGDDDELDLEKPQKYKFYFVTVALIAIAGGAEELAIFIPYFSSLSNDELIVALIIFNLLVPMWVTLCKKIAGIPHIKDQVEKYGAVLIPIVFIALGLYVLIDQNTFAFIGQLLR